MIDESMPTIFADVYSRHAFLRYAVRQAVNHASGIIRHDIMISAGRK